MTQGHTPTRELSQVQFFALGFLFKNLISIQMFGSKVLSDLSADQLPSLVGVQTPWGSKHILSIIQSPSSSISELKKRQMPILALRNKSAIAELHQINSEIEKCILPNTTSIDEDSSDPRIKESVQQVFWAPDSLLSPLNKCSPIITGTVWWKSIAIPLISIIMPIMALIVPYFVLKNTSGISMGEYMSHVRKVLLSQVSIPAPLRAKHSSDFVGYLVETFFIGITLFTFVSGIWNQIVSARHLRTIASDLKDRCNAIVTTVESVKRILGILNGLAPKLKQALRILIEKGEVAINPFLNIPNTMAGFGHVWNSPTIVEPLKNWIGELDFVVGVALKSGICFPTFVRSRVHCEIINVYHPSLTEDMRIYNKLSYTNGKTHALLTGPNRGGKSTYCKAVGLSILCAQTMGFAWASKMTLKPFTAIETALSPSDELGKLSLFEAEIEFAKHVLQRADEETNVFVMMDEIFHSTNAADGLSATKVFLERMYSKQNVTSLISTHYKELVAKFASDANSWAMDATEKENGELLYSYKLVPGVSDKSSVMEILKERGLICEKSPNP